MGQFTVWEPKSAPKRGSSPNWRAGKLGFAPNFGILPQISELLPQSRGPAPSRSRSNLPRFSDQPAGEHFLRPECSTWLYSLGKTWTFSIEFSPHFTKSKVTVDRLGLRCHERSKMTRTRTGGNGNEEGVVVQTVEYQEENTEQTNGWKHHWSLKSTVKKSSRYPYQTQYPYYRL